MEKFELFRIPIHLGIRKKWLIAMKTLILLVCVFSIQLNASVLSQQTVSLKMSNVSAKELIREIEAQTNLGFIYSLSEIEKLEGISIEVEEQTVKEVLDQVLEDTDLTYELEKSVIIIMPKPAEPVQMEEQEKRTIKGTVVDEDGKPLPFAAVCFKGTTTGCVAAVDGTYTLEVIDEENLVLEVSSLGYVTQIIPVNDRSIINIVMVMDTENLDEVIVTGFQTISKERSSGSYTKVDEKELDKPIIQVSDALEGKLGNVQYTRNESGDLNILVRGSNSGRINNIQRYTQKPLIVVDGFPIEGDFEDLNPDDIESLTLLKDAAASSIWGARSANGVIVITTKSGKKSKTPVVEINTFLSYRAKPDLNKRLNRMSSSESIDMETYWWDTAKEDGRGGYWGHSGTTATPNNLEYYYRNEVNEIFNQYYLDYGTEDGMTLAERNAALDRYRKLDNTDQIKDHLYNNYVLQNYNASITTGNEKSTHRLSLNFRDANEDLEGNDSKSYKVNYNTSYELTDWLRFDLRSSFNYVDESYSGNSSAYDWQQYSPISLAQSLAPFTMLLNEDGSYRQLNNRFNANAFANPDVMDNSVFPYQSMGYNPIEEIKSRDFNAKRLNARFQFGLDFKLSKSLKFNTKLQYEIVRTDNDEWYSENSYYTRKAVNYSLVRDEGEYKAYLPKGGMHQSFGSEANNFNFRNQLDFNKVFNENHRIVALIGTEYSKSETDYISNPTYFGYDKDKNSFGQLPYGYNQDGSAYSVFGGWYPVGMSVATTPGTLFPPSQVGYGAAPLRGKRTDVYVSAYFNASYTYRDKYTFTASARTDAANFVSEKTQDKFSPFWSVGANWQIGREDFMSQYDWLDRLTLRSSYGFNGIANKNITSKTLLSLNSSRDINTGTYHSEVDRLRYGNPNLTWEKVGTYNIAVDYSILNGKLSGTFEYYNKQSRDMLVALKSQPSVGTSEMIANEMELSNKGIEINISSRLNVAKNIKWYGSLDFSYNKNKVEDVFTTPDFQSLVRWSQPKKGYNANTLWGLKYDGMDEGFQHYVVGRTKINEEGNEYIPRTTYAYHNIGDTENYEDYLYNKGTTVAPYLLGFTTGFEIHNFELSATITGKFGHVFKRKNIQFQNYDKNTSFDKNVLEYMVDEYDFESKDYQIGLDQFYNWNTGNAESVNQYIDEAIADAGHIRFREINLSYKIPKNLLTQMGLSSLKVYAQAQNVGTILFNDHGEDPELGYRINKPTYTLGLKCSF